MARILIADDEVAVLETLRLYLDSTGHEVVGADTVPWTPGSPQRRWGIDPSG